MTDKHGGNIMKLALAAGKPMQDILDFSANINPLGAPDWLRPLISSCISSLVHYPDPHCTELRNAIAGKFGITTLRRQRSTENFIFFPGSLCSA